MTSRVPMETIYEEIPHVRAQLREEADQLAASICGPLGSVTQTAEERQPAVRQTTLVEIEHDDRERFREVYLRKVRPYLADPGTPRRRTGRSAALGRNFRSLCAGCWPRRFIGVLDDLENICEEEHQLSRQIRIYRWLHAWLLVHVPLRSPCWCWAACTP